MVILYYLKQPGQVTLTVGGRNVQATNTAGWNRVIWPATGVAAGSYTAVLKVDGAEYSQPVVIR
jgi:hypothetical protein